MTVNIFAENIRKFSIVAVVGDVIQICSVVMKKIQWGSKCCFKQNDFPYLLYVTTKMVMS